MRQGPGPQRPRRHQYMLTGLLWLWLLTILIPVLGGSLACQVPAHRSPCRSRERHGCPEPESRGCDRMAAPLKLSDLQPGRGLVSGGKGGLCRGDAAGAVLRCLRRSQSPIDTIDRLPQSWIHEGRRGTPWPVTPAVKAGASDSSRVAAQSTSKRLRRVLK